MSETWEAKWTLLIERIKSILAREGKELVVLNVPVHPNPKTQYKKFQEVCQTAKDHPEMVVSTSLPGEERIFWVYRDVQFYLPYEEGPIRSTGNQANIQQIINFTERPINTDVIGMDFWKDKTFTFYLDDFKYVDESLLLTDSAPEVKGLANRYKTHQARMFENKEYWYFLPFLFMGSELMNIDGFGDLSGGVPNKLEILCSCGQVLKREHVLKGMLRFPQYNTMHQYYLWLSEECPACHNTNIIYRDKALEKQHYFIPMRPFFNFADPSWQYSLEDEVMVGGWQAIMKQAWDKDSHALVGVYASELEQFGDYIQRMGNKYKI